MDAAQCDRGHGVVWGEGQTKMLWTKVFAQESQHRGELHV